MDCHTKKYKSTANFNYAIVSNLPKDRAIFLTPNQMWIGNIAHIPADEGLLYLAIQKIDVSKRNSWPIDAYKIDKQAHNKFILDEDTERKRPEKGSYKYRFKIRYNTRLVHSILY